MLTISRIEKSFGPTRVLADVTLDIGAGEVFTLLGASGCGKTTLLRIIAGLETADSGDIRFNDTAWVSGRGPGLSPQKRNVGLVFQSYAIWPHLSVFEQVAYPLRSRRVARAEIAPRVHAALESVGMAPYAARPAQQLSGGQQQRVAMARALVSEPSLLLLDEPFSNLDVALRDQLRFELRQIQKRLGITIVLVTHDQADAFALSDRIAILRHGVVEQVGTPEDIYARPATEYVQGFVGRTSRLAGVWHGAAGVALGGDTRIAVDGGGVAGLPDGSAVSLLVRPQDVRLVDRAAVTGDGPALPGRVVDRLFVGDRYECLVELDGGQSLLAYQEIGGPAAADVAVRFDRLPRAYAA